MAVFLAVTAQTPAAQSNRWQPSAGHAQIPLWPAVLAAPDSESLATASNLVAGKPWTYISNVSRPTLTVYSPAGANTGAAVLVFPGGGYQILAIDLEGTEVCDWLVAKGITCVLLKYRVPNTGGAWSEQCGCDTITRISKPLADAQRAMGLIRLHAAEWQIDPHKIGVLGFSAGGHLSAVLSTHFDQRLYDAVDSADQQSCRPDFAVVIYPGYLALSEQNFAPNADIHVSEQTPPTFLLQAEDDPVHVENATVYFGLLKNARVPAELHIYSEGGHGYGLRPTDKPVTHWPNLVETWLKTIGMTK